MTKSYRLQSYQGPVFVVDEAVAFQSPLVERLAAFAGTGGTIVLENADAKSLRKVLEWCEMHTPEKKATVPPEDLRKWEDEYFDPCRVPVLLLTAVTYMEMDELEEFMYQRITDKARALAGRDTEEMGRQIRAGKVSRFPRRRHSAAMW